MKLRTILLTTTVVAAASTGVVLAQAPDGASDNAGDRPPGHHLHKLWHKVNRLFNALDTDGNEIITLDEFLVKPTEKAQVQFDRIDSDNDELISLDEWRAIRDRFDDAGPDVDRDAVRQCVADTLQTDVPERPDPENVFDEIDTNDDGFIDYDEFLTAKLEAATNRFNRIDADGDGGITKRELAKALKKHRQLRVTRRHCVEDQRETDELLGS